jgi:hypothetical protein
MQCVKLWQACCKGFFILEPFFIMQGILCNQFISDGTVVNKERQKGMLVHLKAMWPKCIKVWVANNLMMLHENALIC